MSTKSNSRNYLVGGLIGGLIGGILGYITSRLTREEPAEQPTGGADIIIKSFLCSICKDLMVKPVVDSHGHCYCKNCIDDWLDISLVCPLSNQPLTKDELRRCIDLEYAIEEYRLQTKQ